MNMIIGILVIVVGMIFLPTVLNVSQNFETVSVPVQSALDLTPVFYIIIIAVIAIVYFKGGSKA